MSFRCERLRPSSEDLVVVHGDYSLPNLIMQNGEWSGFIDLGQVCVADKYVDFVALHHTLRYNKFPDNSFSVCMEKYGLPQWDADKLHFYDLLDRFDR